ncbi:MAG: hypothetical protein HUU31_21385 [Anaerolineae bacterium]|nr:hypothetical protein [Anaerolineae bacterium]
MSEPSAAVSQAAADLLITCVTPEPGTPTPFIEEDFMNVDAEGVLLYYTAAGSFRISEGRRIVIQPLPGADPRMIEHLLLGPCIAVALHQRGCLVLHGSAVETAPASTDPSAAIFVGWSGQGKSTLVGALRRRGFRVLADDVTPIQVRDFAKPVMMPGLSRLKLWPEAAAALGDDPDHLPQAFPKIEKRLRQVEAPSQQPIPVQAIFLLDKGEQHRIEAMGVQEAFMALVNHTYTVPLVRMADTARDHFAQCEALVRAVPVYRLIRHWSLDALDALVTLVERSLV